MLDPLLQNKKILYRSQNVLMSLLEVSFLDQPQMYFVFTLVSKTES